jgi:hypothetical protein
MNNTINHTLHPLDPSFKTLHILMHTNHEFLPNPTKQIMLDQL